MKFLVAYKSSPEGKAALQIALKHARHFDALVYVITSQEGGSNEKPEEVGRIKQDLASAKIALEQAGIDCRVYETVRGLSAGEDLVRFAKEKKIDHIFVGVEKKSRTKKILLGSTAQYIILKAPCPVTTVK